MVMVNMLQLVPMAKLLALSDGKNWSTNVLMSGYKSWSFYSVTYATNRFIAIGSKGNVAYSSDGLVGKL